VITMLQAPAKDFLSARTMGTALFLASLFCFAMYFA
jgi:hypothetical protein